jgi:putative endonuclease
MSKAAHLQIGEEAENAACAFLQSQQLTLIARNVRYRFGELDIVMLDRAILVFVEVRYRRSKHFGGGMASVDQKKCRRFANAAQAWLNENIRYQQHACRFDVIAASGNVPNLDFDWQTDAFRLDDIS